MLDIPFVGNSGKACALACYTMVAQYFFPRMTFEEVGKISKWEPGYVVWAFPFWTWMMDKGFAVTYYDVIDYDSWIKEGVVGLQKSVSPKEFQYYKKNSKDLNALADDIRKVFEHKNFSFIQRRPTFNDLKRHFKESAVCTVVLDACTLDHEEGFSLHQVIVLDISDTEITFHNPRKKPRPAQIETVEHFCKAWLEAVDSPGLITYKKI